MLQVLDSLVATYVFALFTVFIHAIDTVLHIIPVPAQNRSIKYLLVRILPLTVILLGDVGLICFIEIDRSREGTWWLLALWVLLEFSILFGLSLEVSAAFIPLNIPC